MCSIEILRDVFSVSCFKVTNIDRPFVFETRALIKLQEQERKEVFRYNHGFVTFSLGVITFVRDKKIITWF